jgi:P27 family predicted phage terminase small subunit
MPKKLTRDAQAEWKRLLPELLRTRILTRFDEGLFRVTIEAFDDYVRCRALVRKDGYVIQEKRAEGQVITKKHPAEMIVRNAWMRYVTGCRELGCSPGSRKRVAPGVTPREEASSSKIASWAERARELRRNVGRTGGDEA